MVRVEQTGDFKMTERIVKLVGGPHSNEHRNVAESTQRYIISVSREWDHHYVQHRLNPDQFVYENSMEVKCRDEDVQGWYSWAG